MPLKKIIPAVIFVNFAGLLAILAGVVDLGKIGFLYWAECALVGLVATAMYGRYLIVFFVLSCAIGWIVYIANPSLFEYKEPLYLFWALYSVCWLAYLEIGKTRYGQFLRKLKSGQQLAYYLSFLAGSILFCYLITHALYPWEQQRPPEFYPAFTCAALLIPTISIAVMKLIGMIGEKHFMDYLLGTYVQPQMRNSIVLFLDMVGSSTIAEKLEPQMSMKLIAQFIYDCGYIFRIHGGDILNYTGDGLVVIWPRKSANQALSAASALQQHFSNKDVKMQYWRRFGIEPAFRVGVHAGNVVISQIGEEKLFLGLYGDVVNTAARLEQMNKQLGTRILVSSDVLVGLNQSWKALLKPLGEHEVRGRDEKIKVFTIYNQV